LLQLEVGRQTMQERQHVSALDQRQRLWTWAFWASLVAFEVVGRILAWQS
jgi:hypothetical protein